MQMTAAAQVYFSISDRHGDADKAKMRQLDSSDSSIVDADMLRYIALIAVFNVAPIFFVHLMCTRRGTL